MIRISAISFQRLELLLEIVWRMLDLILIVELTYELKLTGGDSDYSFLQNMNVSSRR